MRTADRKRPQRRSKLFDSRCGGSKNPPRRSARQPAL
jgi:hypothetical protein